MSWRKSLYSDGMCLLDPPVLSSVCGGPKTVGLGTKTGLGTGGDAEVNTLLNSWFCTTGSGSSHCWCVIPWLGVWFKNKSIKKERKMTQSSVWSAGNNRKWSFSIGKLQHGDLWAAEVLISAISKMWQTRTSKIKLKVTYGDSLSSCLFCLVSSVQGESVHVTLLFSAWPGCLWPTLTWSPSHLCSTKFAERDWVVLMKHNLNASIGDTSQPVCFHGLLSCNIIFP